MKAFANAVWPGVVAVLLASGLAASGGNPFVSADQPFNRAAAKARAEFRVSTTDGTTRVVYRGKRVFAGKTSGVVLARRMNVHGTDSAVVWDERQVVWQSAPGVAERLGAVPAGQEPGATPPPVIFRLAPARLETTTAGGETRLFFNERQVFAGRTRGLLTTKSKVTGDTAFAAAWDGDRLLWENVPGAAKQLQ